MTPWAILAIVLGRRSGIGDVRCGDLQPAGDA